MSETEGVEQRMQRVAAEVIENQEVAMGRKCTRSWSMISMRRTC
jgi:hypothetical protein